jgi:hypothetical protein
MISFWPILRQKNAEKWCGKMVWEKWCRFILFHPKGRQQYKATPFFPHGQRLRTA